MRSGMATCLRFAVYGVRRQHGMGEARCLRWFIAVHAILSIPQFMTYYFIYYYSRTQACWRELCELCMSAYKMYAVTAPTYPHQPTHPHPHTHSHSRTYLTLVPAVNHIRLRFISIYTFRMRSTHGHARVLDLFFGWCFRPFYVCGRRILA